MKVMFGQGTFVVDKNFVLNRGKDQSETVRKAVREEEPLGALRTLDDSLRLRFDVHYDYDGNGHPRDHGGDKIVIEHREPGSDAFVPVKNVVRDMPREAQRRSWWRGGDITPNKGQTLKEFLMHAIAEAADYFDLVSEIR